MTAGNEPRSRLLPASTTTLLVVDVQERFRPAMSGFEDMLRACVRLARAFGELDLPVVVSEQYPRGLGPTVAELRAVLGEGEIPAKTCFSALGSTDVATALEPATAVVVCGIETHVCVLQTVDAMLAAGRTVHVAVDAVASRSDQDRDVALRRMERAGAVLTTAETAAFELLRDASHPAFKRVQALYR